MPSISQRANKTSVLPTQRYNVALRSLEKQGVKIWKLHEGDPHLPAPPSILQELHAYNEESISYPGGAGLPQHLKAWSTYYSKHGFSIPTECIIPTVGGSEAIHMALFIATDPGDEVLVFDPIYSGFQVIASMLDCRLVPIETSFSSSFKLPPHATWDKKVIKRTKAIVVINPDNPTGRFLSHQELKQIVFFAQKHDLILIVDEAYRGMLLNTTKKSESIFEFIQCHDRLIVLDSISKRCGVPGMRIGVFVSLNREIMKQALKFATSRASTARIEQLASIPLLQGSQKPTRSNAKEVRLRLSATIKQLSKIHGLEFCSPAGGLFVAAKVPGVDMYNFLQFCLNDFRHQGQTVTILPLQDFYISKSKANDELRIAAVYPPKDMMKAIKLLDKALAEYRARK